MVAVGVVVAITAAACGGNGEAEAESGAGAILEELAGLDKEQRRSRLIELSAGEDAELTFYTTMNIDDAGVVLDAFEDAYGIEVSLYRASASSLLQRTLQETEAGFSGADAIAVGAAEMTVLDEEGVLEELDTPHVDEIVASAVRPTWAGIYLNVFAASWNDATAEAGRAPTNWEEVLSAYQGGLVMEISDFDWFGALVEDYFVGSLGYTEDEAVDLFRSAASQARGIEGHSLMAELLAGGEFDVAASTYQHGVERFRARGAPISWEPAVEPLVMRPTGIGLHRASQAPAKALLFIDFMLTDAQPILAELHRTPANQTVDGGIPVEYEVISVSDSVLGEDRQKWEELYEQVIGAGSESSG
jgi:iron(III) transport system substrate-binding protein